MMGCISTASSAAARPTGLGAAYQNAITTRRMLITGLVALAIALIFGHFTGLIAWMTATIAAC